jgi:MscS family membrane protein
VDLVVVALRKLTADETIAVLVRKTLRIFILIIFALFVVQNTFGQEVTPWLAGLGLAGLAVSLAAQGPIKNIFGSVTVVLDRPFGLGDTIRYGDVTGTVENMGFRSTKLRTADGYFVTIPNMKLIDDVVENISSRPSIRRNFAITITCDTPPPKVEQAISIIGDLLREPFMAETFNTESPPRVYFTGFNADSLNIQVTYWYQLSTPGRDPWTYQAQCQEFNLKLLRAFADAGIELAFPTQTIFLAGDAHRQLSVHLAHNGEETLAHGIRAGAAR